MRIRSGLTLSACLVTLIGTTVQCGGHANLGRHQNGDGNDATSNPDSGLASSGGSGSNASGAGGNAGSDAGTDWRTGRDWRATGGTMSPPDSVPKLAHLDVLATLRMDEDLSVLAPADCPSTFSLDLDANRDGTIEATERRIFDANGRIVAAEVKMNDAEGTRKRVLVTYDAAGQPIRYTHGIMGKGYIPGFRWADGCGALDLPDPRGAVIDITYAGSRVSSARLVSNEECFGTLDGQQEKGSRVLCETFEFDSKGQFTRRFEDCSDSGTYDYDPEYDEHVSFDDLGRPTVHDVTPRNTFSFWVSPLLYRYPSSNTVELSWSSVQGTGAFLPTQTVYKLTRSLDEKGRGTLDVVDSGNDGVVDGRTTRTFDADGCGYETSFDLYGDGVVDATSRVTCEQGRVTSIRDRNMLSEVMEIPFYFTALGAPGQSTATADVTYDGAGRVLTRSYKETPAKYPETSDSGTFTYDADGFGKTGSVERHLDTSSMEPWDPVRNSNCTVVHACSKKVTAQDATLGRCEFGVGVAVRPAFYQNVPSLRTNAGYNFGPPWSSDVALESYIDDQPEMWRVILE